MMKLFLNNVYWIISYYFIISHNYFCIPAPFIHVRFTSLISTLQFWLGCFFIFHHIHYGICKKFYLISFRTWQAVTFTELSKKVSGSLSQIQFDLNMEVNNQIWYWKEVSRGKTHQNCPRRLRLEVGYPEKFFFEQSWINRIFFNFRLIGCKST